MKLKQKEVWAVDFKWKCIMWLLRKKNFKLSPSSPIHPSVEDLAESVTDHPSQLCGEYSTRKNIGIPKQLSWRVFSYTYIGNIVISTYINDFMYSKSRNGRRNFNKNDTHWRHLCLIKAKRFTSWASLQLMCVWYPNQQHDAFHFISVFTFLYFITNVQKWWTDGCRSS